MTAAKSFCKTSLLILLPIFLSTFIYAQKSVTGNVRDAKQPPCDRRNSYSDRY